jgi:rubrerythrin
LDRIDQLAKSAEDDEARARVAELRRREEARHERRLAALMGGPGGSPRNDQP